MHQYLKLKKMTKKDDLIFKGLHVIAWIIFVGLCIEAGALLVNFVYSLFNPKVLGNLYEKLDLTLLYQQSKWVFFGVYSFVLFIAFLKAALFYVVIELLLKLDLSNPFSSFVAKKIAQISYYTLSIGLISYIAKETTKNLAHHGYDVNLLNKFWVDSQAYILMAAVIYVIHQIFKQGIALQQEKDLTI